MTTESARRYSKEIAALGEGKVIQSHYLLNLGEWSEWRDDCHPSFSDNPSVEFRVKPEPREWWIIAPKIIAPKIIAPKIGSWEARFTNESEVKNAFQRIIGPENYEIIHVREVL